MNKDSFGGLRCAIVHDSILEFGGAERVLDSIIKLFPRSDIFLLAVDKDILKFCFPSLNESRFHFYFNNNIFLRSSLLQFLSPLIWKKLNLENYDLVIASSSYLMSCTVEVRESLNFIYLHSLPKNLFNLIEKNKLQKIFNYSFLIKKKYLDSLLRNKNIISNSFYTKKMLWDNFKINSKVIYPPVKYPRFIKKQEGKYFLSVSRINRVKNIELIIDACNILKLPLKIVGNCNDLNYLNELKKKLGPTVEFLGFKSDKDLEQIYSSAIGTICVSKGEDFGISAVEAQAHGVPVIAFNDGGFNETIIHGKTGILFRKYSIESLIQALQKFQTGNFDPKIIRKNAFRFREQRFIYEIRDYIESLNKR